MAWVLFCNETTFKYYAYYAILCMNDLKVAAADLVTFSPEMSFLNITSLAC